MTHSAGVRVFYRNQLSLKLAKKRRKHMVNGSVVYQDPFHPVLVDSVPLEASEEQNYYIKEVLDLCCSDSASAKKAYAAIQFILSTAPPVAPIVTSLEPATAVIGDPSFDIHVIGTGFTPDSVIVFNGFDEPTTFVSDTELTTGVNMPLWQAPAVVPVSVRNGNLVSEALNFEFTNPVILFSTPVQSDDKKVNK